MSFGDVIEIEEDFLDINPFRSVRVQIDITKPLKRFQLIKLKNHNIVKIQVKYECLPHFCFLCGLLCHTEKDCTFVAEEKKEEGYGWGMNIRASPRKGLSKNVEEINALRAKKSLFVSKPLEKTVSDHKEKDKFSGEGISADNDMNSEQATNGTVKLNSKLLFCLYPLCLHPLF